jgi:PhnB protein
MASRLNPYISFNGNARDAMEFYRGVFGGELTVSTFGEFGMPAGPGSDNVMHAQLETPAGFTLMASDMPPGSEDDYSPPTGTVTVSLSGDDDDLRTYWEKLADGGTVSMPLEKQMWGDEFGMCVDRFGTPWMVNIGPGQG